MDKTMDSAFVLFILLIVVAFVAFGVGWAACQCGRSDAEIMDRNCKECRWFTLRVPPDMKLLAGPPPEPEPACLWNTPDPDDPNEIAKEAKKALFTEDLIGERKVKR